jgi:hypothetical protein
MSFVLRGRSSGEGDSDQRGPHWWLWVARPGAFVLSQVVPEHFWGLASGVPMEGGLLSAFQCVAGSPSSAVVSFFSNFPILNFPNFRVMNLDLATDCLIFKSIGLLKDRLGRGRHRGRRAAGR